jgi:hypothetical protein
MSAVWSQYVPERAELVDDPVCDARPLLWDRKRPGLGRVSTAPNSQETENRMNFPQVWKAQVLD